MTTHDPLDSLNHLESSFFQSGYTAGFAHGALHGLFEGRALGKDQAYDLWDEVGYYEGCAGLWRLALTARDGQDDAAAAGKGKRALAHIDGLIGLIALFPTENSSGTTPAPSRPASPASTPINEGGSGLASLTAATPEASQLDARGKETDIAGLLERIRAKYKLVCSALGVRPRLAQVKLDDAGTREGADDDVTGGGGSGPSSGLEKGQVVVNGEKISSKQLLF